VAISALPPAVQVLAIMANDTSPGMAAQLAAYIASIGPTYVDPHLPQLRLALGATSQQFLALSRALHEAKRVLRQGSGTVARQHTISKALLSRFTEVLDPRSGSQLIHLHLHPRSWGPKAPRSVGFITDFVRIDSETTEALWKEVEDRLPQAIGAAEDGSILSEPELLALLRDAIALHFARSPSTRDLHERLFQELFDRAVSRMAATPAAWPYCEEAFRRAHGGLFPPATAEGRHQGAELFYAQVRTPFEAGIPFRFRVESLFEKVREMLRTGGVELLRVPPSRTTEFLISDAGALAVDLGRDAVGSGEGVTLGGATTILLPLGPRLLLALGPQDRIADAPEETVERVNRLQLRAAHTSVYFRPGALGSLPRRFGGRRAAPAPPISAVGIAAAP
jgi:hypothetical protein